MRVLISRLRQKLKDFYDSEGTDEPFELQILLGTHSLTVIRRSGLTEPAAQQPAVFIAVPPVPSIQRPEQHRLLPLLLLLCVALFISTGWLLWDLHRVEASRVQNSTAATTFWKTFFSGPTSAAIILPSPVFFVYSRNKELHVRDVNVNDYASRRNPRRFGRSGMRASRSSITSTR